MMRQITFRLHLSMGDGVFYNFIPQRTITERELGKKFDDFIVAVDRLGCEYMIEGVPEIHQIGGNAKLNRRDNFPE